MKITYIYHSSFFVETDTCCLIFDFFKDSGKIKDIIQKAEKPVYVFSSHKHHDHFNSEIFSWKTLQPNIKYILSKDIIQETLSTNEDAIYLEKGETYKDEFIFVKAFGSTDEGISFYIETSEGSLFHAGDLNNWHWEEESTPAESLEYERAYHEELAYVNAEIKEIDIVMFPIDKRLGVNYFKGAVEFLECICTKLFIPMHFGSDFASASAFKNETLKRNCQFFEISQEYDSIEWF